MCTRRSCKHKYYQISKIMSAQRNWFSPFYCLFLIHFTRSVRAGRIQRGREWVPLRRQLRLNQQFLFHDISGRFQRLPSEPWSPHNVYVHLHRSMFQSSLLSSSSPPPPTSSFALHFLLDSVIFSLFLSSFLSSLLLSSFCPFFSYHWGHRSHRDS